MLCVCVCVCVCVLRLCGKVMVLSFFDAKIQGTLLKWSLSFDMGRIVAPSVCAFCWNELRRRDCCGTS